MPQHSTSSKKPDSLLLAPSLLSADFSKLGEEVATLEKAGADWIHVDVMDGHFVPNLTIGPLVVKAIRPHTKLPLDCHLMVSEPEKWVEAFAQAGATWITVHAEATHHLNRLIHQVKETGCKVGVSLNPSSSLTLIEEVLDLVDLVLIMSVNPGFGGQKCIESSFSKVERLAEMRKKSGTSFLIQVDGGVHAGNAGQFVKAGAEVFVAGSAIFSTKNVKDAIQTFKEALSKS